MYCLNPSNKLEEHPQHASIVPFGSCFMQFHEVLNWAKSRALLQSLNSQNLVNIPVTCLMTAIVTHLACFLEVE